jgi:phage terminase large subunit-like protein
MKSNHYKELEIYCDNIIKNKILSGIYTKKAVKRFLTDLKSQKDDGFPFLFIPERAEEVINFAESLIVSDIDTKDKKLKLLPWHKFIYYNLFGWYYKDDNTRRRFRFGYVEVGRKNSKTTSLLFPIILYDFLTTPAAESYLASKDGIHAEKTFKEIKRIVKSDSRLKEKISETISALTYKDSRIAFFSSESVSTDGYKNSISVIDEFHSFDSDKIITSFRYGTRTRKNGLLLIITSAGLDISGPCYAENEKAKKILNGILTDETYFTIIYSYDDKDDWKNPNLFIKANPSLGTILKQEILENDLNDALITPSHQSDFKSKTCGIWTNDTTNWISLQQWDTEKRNRIIDINKFKGQVCYGGLDLSSVNDFTAYTKCFQKEGVFYLFHKFYIPSEQIIEKYRVENINIREWINNGIVTATPGPTIDYEFIKKDIIEDAKIFNIVELAYDRWQSNKLIDSLDEIIPETILVQYDQSLKHISGPSKNFERLILEDKIVDVNPVMKWMVVNAVIKPDANNNFKPLKKYSNSIKRIDGVITSIMSIDRCQQSEREIINKNFDDILILF